MRVVNTTKDTLTSTSMAVKSGVVANRSMASISFAFRIDTK